MKWFRLYTDILDDSKLRSLEDGEKWRFICLLALASEQNNNGLIYGSIDDLSWRIRCRVDSLDKTIEKLSDLNILKQNGNGRLLFVNWQKRQFKSDNVTERVKRYRNVSRNVTETLDETAPETDTETDIYKPPIIPPKTPSERSEKLIDGGGSFPKKEKQKVTVKDSKGVEHEIPACPHQEIIDLYHEILPSLPPIKLWSGNPRVHLSARWRENFIRRTKIGKPGGLPFWKWYFQYVGASDFLTGRTQKTKNIGWKCTLRWLVNPTNFQKVVNGEYHSIEKKEEDD